MFWWQPFRWLSTLSGVVSLQLQPKVMEPIRDIETSMRF